ncbi:MAG TPA: hypothetical protein VFP59_02495 [Candidatus Angelobacter sp.]|nr:hypothetical protein [Candidatus Angelobacter sp.]
MRVHWEKLGILAPVYDLAGHGFSDNKIAGKLNISEDKVRPCVAWLLRFCPCGSRAQLACDAASAMKSACSKPQFAVAKEAS